MEKQSNISNGRGGARPGAGRPKGALDKGNAMIREMIVEALDGVGGVDYLQDVARSHPTAFLGLVGKVMPVQVNAAVDVEGEVTHKVKVDLDFDAIRAKVASL